MSWLQRLVETYDACFDNDAFQKQPLTPIDHVVQQAHIEIAIDEGGKFLRASVVLKENTLIPATEASAGRTSGAVAHPLCDKVRYVAKDYGSPDHELYRKALGDWAEFSNNPKLNAILSYIEHGTVVEDLVRVGVLVRSKDGKLESRWIDGPSELSKLLTADPKTKLRDQGNALIRWSVELPGCLRHSVWQDSELQRSWAEYIATMPGKAELCFASGASRPSASSHPKRLRHGGDGAKLISSNDNSGYTFRGRFVSSEEAYGLSAEATQKAHNALRWLIARQGERSGNQVTVAWAVKTAAKPEVLVDTAALFATFGDAEDEEPETPVGAKELLVDVAQEYALRLTKAIQGYRAAIADTDEIVVMSIDSATPGRMAIVYYRELTGSELLRNVQCWHEKLAWPQNFGKDHRFVGAPAPRDIAEAAYGRRIDDKLKRATVERLLPCIVDGTPIPRDLVRITGDRACNRIGMEPWEFERVLGIACSLYRGAHPQEFPSMSLDETRTSRDYLYGRLLAVADDIESFSLFLAGEKRETNAARLTQRFADHPFTTWRTLEMQLRPYIARLNNQRAGRLTKRKLLMDSIIDSFEVVDGKSAFLDNSRLDGEFLLGFHSQRAALRRKNPYDPTSAIPTEIEGDQE